ncbi:hypothetical protein [Sphaerotilus sp.]|uniref:hypothetical protein n=1 Tax=Sphaerotilus sp. TaxID=2093942 RepID=UPI002ACD2129|nr:hypothetical protein [Sphaerotilus sp.]MDZ7854664.1 hypothetical protein [Sphaerotilus sp.]
MSTYDAHPPDNGLRLWLRVFGAMLAAVVGLLLWTLLTPPFQGDLTRLGRLSETAFGPTQATRAIDPALRVSSTLQAADVLVIGDSFSVPLLWQSVLVERGLRVATIGWQAIGPLCADLGEVLRAQGFRGSAVVVESVERGLAAHLDAALACTHTRPGRLSAQQAPRDWATAGPFGLNTRETLFTGLLTSWHTHRARTTQAEELLHHTGGADRVRIQRVPDGCLRFSHPLCERGLFFADDRTSPPLTASSVGQMQQISRRHADLAITWVVMPNKSTVYLPAASTAATRTAGAALEAAGLGPDLFAEFAQRIHQTRDLYSPNDTHTSPDGYRVTGARVHAWLVARTRS